MKVNSFDCFYFAANFPRFGAWSVDLSVKSSKKMLSGKVKISDGLNLDGYVVLAEKALSGDEYFISPFKTNAVMPAKNFYASSRYIATHIASAIGVQLASCPDVPSMKFTIQETDSPLSVLASFCVSLGANFIFADNGALSIVVPSKSVTAYKGKYRLVDRGPKGLVTLGLDAFDLRPSHTLEGRKLGAVSYVSTADSTRAIAVFL